MIVFFFSILYKYSNSTIQVLIDFLKNFSTNCDAASMNQRRIQVVDQLETLK